VLLGFDPASTTLVSTAHSSSAWACRWLGTEAEVAVVAVEAGAGAGAGAEALTEVEAGEEVVVVARW
jgi:hypothetical protein